MKQRLYFLLSALFLSFLVMAFTFRAPVQTDRLNGSWSSKTGDQESILLFIDGYFTYSAYSKEGKKFIGTCGGTFTLDGKELNMVYEFSTWEKEQVGKTISYPVAFQGDQLLFSFDGKEEKWNRIDDGKTGLSGLWKISARKGEGGLVPIHQAGTRKTVKILSGTRFQWAAIDPGTKGFMGTGGGTYTFKDGKYTENIEFFSRDSSRVGSSLSFDGKVEQGDWHHSGLSSRGEPIYEVWSRKK